MSIRRRAIGAGSKRRGGVTGDAGLNAASAVRQGRQVFGEVLTQASGAVKQEIEQARAVYSEAQKALAEEAKAMRSAMAASRAASQSTAGAAPTEHGPTAARKTMAAMMEQLNRITSSLGAGAPPGTPGTGKGTPSQ